MNDVTIATVGIAPCRFPWVEKALREVWQMPITEACVSGLCDICPYQAGLCMVATHDAEDSPSSRHSAEQKNKS